MVKAVALTESYGTHSFLRGGAQVLCFAGWSLQDIQLFGRWASLVIELYLLEAPDDRVSGQLIGYDDRYRVEVTPPYWPNVASPELMWNNLELDSRNWDFQIKSIKDQPGV